MADEPRKVVSERKLSFMDFVKFIGALGVIIPLLMGYFEYRRSVQQDIDNNFRNLVEKLSSEKIEERLAGATNLGTFVSNGDKYYNESIDILINAVAIEKDISVLNAIRGSLEKIDKKDYKKVIQQLLVLDRNAFVYEYPLDYLGLKEQYNELLIQKLLVAHFISTILTFTRTYPIDSLLIYQNSLSRLPLTDLSLKNSTIQHSAISSSIIINVDFSNSRILSSAFSFSKLYQCDFSNCNIESTLIDNVSRFDNTSFRGAVFKDVFFIGSDLRGVDFTRAQGLKPIYFYGAKNIDKAKFDVEFLRTLNELDAIDEIEFTDYVYNSSLTEQRMNEVLENNYLKDWDSTEK
jgi:hypothetical protein